MHFDVRDVCDVHVTWTHGHHVHGHAIGPRRHLFHVLRHVNVVRRFQHHQRRLATDVTSDLVVHVRADRRTRRIRLQLVCPAPLQVLSKRRFGFGEGVLQRTDVSCTCPRRRVRDVQRSCRGCSSGTCSFSCQILHGVRPGCEIRLGVDLDQRGMPTTGVHVHGHRAFGGVPVRFLPGRRHASLAELFHGTFHVAIAGLKRGLDFGHRRTAGGTQRTDGVQAHLGRRTRGHGAIQAPSQRMDGSFPHRRHPREDLACALTRAVVEGGRCDVANGDEMVEGRSHLLPTGTRPWVGREWTHAMHHFTGRCAPWSSRNMDGSTVGMERRKQERDKTWKHGGKRKRHRSTRPSEKKKWMERRTSRVHEEGGREEHRVA
mmetsp:Transcript_2900/g.18141  ORF Transcript_2900/g.18141 Transcript_2900/m.18141 type:complete len:374 (-) Transcript_2900:1516-2637(-)